MALAKVDSVAVSSSGALNVSVCDRKKHPASFELPFADSETIDAYFREKSLTKAPRTEARGGKSGLRRRVCSLRRGRSRAGRSARDDRRRAEKRGIAGSATRHRHDRAARPLRR
ncbi:hypothetical protein [Burkholderia ubonensis]|uniref:hypothetical protein n=1 Tax=Burkholderia ubonensis TaxID=101571 RepID=UPI0012FAEF39|nr:hypothetical protein [Burkholderia ubonensis]